MELEPKIKDLLWELYKETQTTHYLIINNNMDLFTTNKVIINNVYFTYSIVHTTLDLPYDNNQTYIIPIVQKDKPIKVYFSDKEIPQIN